MIYSLTWLSSVLKAAGLKVQEQPGWQTRGHGDVGTIKGVLCHHTAGPKDGNMPSLNTVINGRSDLAGPLCNLALGRDGTYYIVAAGLAYHAGGGSWHGVTNGNHELIGIEAENTGVSNDTPWPPVQYDAYQKGCAALLQHIHASVDMCAGHKEYALPHGRKSDPDFDMNKFRDGVAKYMHVFIPLPNSTPNSMPKYKVVGVKPSSLSLRIDASVNSLKKGAIPEDTVVEELGRQGTFVHVRTPAGYTGWVDEKFLVLV